MSDDLVLGIMSGTSLDGVDYALCAISGESIRLARLWHTPFPRWLRVALFDAAGGQLGCHAVAQLHHDLGRFYATGAGQGLGGLKPRAVGLHGQTVFHRPDPTCPATFQLGEPAYLAERLLIPVVSNFRVADLAAGGEGAPLATAFHERVFGERGRHICVNNLGGISNVTSIDWRSGRRPRLLSFDTGPANVLLDLAARHFSRGQRHMDKDGAWAKRGHICEPLLGRWLKHRFFRQTPPKSTGREMFGDRFFAVIQPEMTRASLDRFDSLATLTLFSGRSLALNYRLHLPSWPSRVVLCGGGAANKALVGAVRSALFEAGGETEVLTSADLGWPLLAVEPAAFAWLAWLRLRGRTGHRPETTGARRRVLLGQICEGRKGVS